MGGGVDVLLTGDRGFLGKRIISRGEQQIEGVPFAIDLRVQPLVDSMFAVLKPRVVIHAAAKVGGIVMNTSQQADLLTDNVSMAVNVMRAAYAEGAEYVILVSSVCIYSDEAPLPWRETDAYVGMPHPANRTYGIAKRLLMQIGQAYASQHGMKVLSLVLANLYGPGDRSGHVIPMLLERASRATDVLEVWGDPDITRDFLFVEDAVDAIYSVLSVRPTGIMNIGTRTETSIRQLAEKIARVSNYSGEIKFNLGPSGQPRRKVDYTHASRVLNWRPLTDLDTGLEFCKGHAH